MASEISRVNQEEVEPQKLNRRRIYLHRLVGDDVRAPRAKSSRRTSWRVILRFLVYAFIAMFVITSRSNVYELSEVNIGVQAPLRRQWFRQDPSPMYFEDIETVSHVATWLTRVPLAQLVASGDYDNPLSLLAYNRITPMNGVCPEFAAITITLRRVKTTAAYADTTTSRFRQLFPKAWVADSLAAGSGGSSSAEATDVLTSRLDERVQWSHTSRCEGECDGTDYRPHGYLSQGGYVALLTVSEMGLWVHLVNNDAAVSVSPETGICGGIRESTTVTWSEFIGSGFFDSQFGSLAIEFLTYNANLQTMTDVFATFQGSSAGLITKKEIRVESIRLDIYDDIMRYFEVAYLVFTGCYFFEFCYRAYKYQPQFLYDIWSYINFVSIVMSLTSLALWYMYMPELQKFVQSSDFEIEGRMHRCFNFVLWYLRCGSLASLTICLRILKFMGDLNSRVRLLLRTLHVCAKKMGIYILYVSVIFLGFTAFAFIKFAASSKSFVTPFRAFLSCFELFMGNTSSIFPVEGYFKVPFFLLFMVFFYFISVQMFNAIINYAYNLISEQMEPEFEQEQRERKRQELQRLSASKDLLQHFRDYLFALTGRQKPEEAAAPKDTPEAEKKKQGALEGMDEKERAEHAKGKEKRKMPDSVCRIILFFVFAACYMWFLVINLNVSESSDVKLALVSSIEGADVSDFSVPNLISRIKWDDIFSLTHVVSWLYGSLPLILFNSTSESSAAAAIQQGIHPPGAVCIRNWNCLITAPGFPPSATAGTAVSGGTGQGTQQVANATGNSTVDVQTNQSSEGVRRWPPRIVAHPPLWARPRNIAMVRITQRRSRISPNTGCATVDTPADSCFTGGSTNTSSGNWSNFAQVLVPTRLPARPVWPEDEVRQDEDRNIGFELEYWGMPFCKSVADKGFARTGGIVCMLDMDYGSFVSQISMMERHGFFSRASTSFAIDFAVYNGNKNMLIYTLVKFDVWASGRVWKTVQVSALSLLDFTDFLDTYQNKVLRILPGFLYIVLVFKFAWDLHWDLRQEIYRKRLNGNSSWIVAVIEFITLDVFNLLEAISISISFVSFILYIMWLVKEGDLADRLDGNLNDLLDYCMDLSNQARLYNRLSAMNCLLIFVRPLKFVRQSVRFAQLYQTLWEARTDIGWFVFMFAITMLGFVMFSYVSFGPFFAPCRTLPNTVNFLFNYILGNFDFWPLFEADPLMAIIFFFPYLLIFYLVFLNIFFAIIDRYYVPKESPPLNLKRRLKPIFQRICRCIEWDEDYVMEADPNMEKKTGPPSRQSKVKELVQSINLTVGVQGQTFNLKGSKLLNEVCDTDDRMGEVLHWSREEAGKVVMDFHRMLQKKQTVKNDEVFIKADVMKHIREEAKTVKEDMEEAERLMRYATKVHEQMALRDQETLAKYIFILELKIRNRMKQRHELEREVRHLRSESDKMRFTDEELNQHAGAVQVRNSERWAAEDEEKDMGSDDSDEEPAPKQEPVAAEAGAAGAEARGSGGATGGDLDPRVQRRQEKTDALLSLRD